MAIVGITCNDERVPIDRNDYRGKISTGYAPGEGPDKLNYPTASGFFRFLLERTVNERMGTKTFAVKKWVINPVIQEKLESYHSQGKSPRMLEIVSLFDTPDQMWDSFMASYISDGLSCKSHGKGTTATYLETSAGGDREWLERVCEHTDCPIFKAGECHPHGVLKCYPTVDFTPPNPYKFETNSINTIVNIESALGKIYETSKLAHAIRLKVEPEAKFKGLFGMKFILIHKKKKSGGKEIFVTEITMSKESRAEINEWFDKAFVTGELEFDPRSMSIDMSSIEIEHSIENAASIEYVESEDPVSEEDIAKSILGED